MAEQLLGSSIVTEDKITALKSELLAKDQLFEDQDFPAESSNIYYTRKVNHAWKRPHEICKNPKFFVGGASRFDVNQGKLGNCWFLSALASLSLHPQLLHQVVPPDQDFDSSDYCGLFHFRFWQYGDWVNVIVDDRLPVCQQNNNAKGPSKWQLVFMQSAQRTEFWSALLEKAYAKLAGSYEALIGGLSSEAMEDFTGGITVSYAPRQVPCPRVLFHTILEANKRSCLMNCSVVKTKNLSDWAGCGLDSRHAYSVTGAAPVKMKTQDALLYCESFVTEDGKPTDEPPGDTVFVPLVRIRNPWGSSREWSGDWGDKSKAWAAVSAEEKARINVKFKGDGEFWMSIKDFCKFFSDLEMCHLGPESLAHARRQAGKLNDKRRCWESVSHKSAWRKRLSAGGCRNNLRSFASNPQFQVTVVDPDETDNDNTGTVIVGLMQINLRRRRAAGDRMLFIGYEIYRRRTDGTGPLDTNFFRYNRCAGFTTHTNKRQVCFRHKLKPGNYVIVPSTYRPDFEMDFLLRVYTERPAKLDEIDDVTAIVDLKIPMEPSAQELTLERALRDAFAKVAGADLEVDAYELRDILNIAFMKEFKFDGFCLETCRSMVAMMDADQSGKLGFQEFKTLWSSLRLWKTAFKKFDEDKSGNFNSYELRQALKAVGYRVSNKIFNCLVMRYANRQGVIEFDDFIVCCVRLKTVFETFSAQEKTADGVSALFSKDKYLSAAAYV
ncbi:hypothetical protein BOX15_Mlig029950g1 [Macrostomum lignano]|uniref:Calpain-3 n=1 Tax=Macrostomum lignano TaxID=282301 RepID=A0A267GVG0_9PLAT|nr:hypothetical protein BOX15_Mlig029950g1 [Macrostomum lignano]